MKLLSYHIENYGKIHAQDGTFEGGLTCICEKNGFGKSTLASFIKAMFYGLPSYTAATKVFQERQRYYPFEGGKFGGNLTFEYGGKTYRIERFFGKKSAKDDECRVYQNGVEYTGFGEEIGKTIFGVDEESFKKTVFITSDEMEISSTHSINEKLNAHGEGDDGGFEGAMEALEKAKKNLKAGRGSGGKINETKAEIVELTSAIKNLEDMGESLTREYAERENLAREIDRMDGELKVAGERDLILQKWEYYDSLLNRKRAREEGLALHKTKYPKGLPTQEERGLLSTQLQQNDLLRGRLQASAFYSQKEESLERLREKFQNGIPMYETMENMQNAITRLSALKAEGERLRASTLSEKEVRLKARFASAMPNEQELQTKLALVEEIKRQKKALKERATEQKQDMSKKKFALGTYLLVLACALLCGGVGVFFVAQAAGIGMLIAGGIFLVAGGAFKTLKPTMPPSNGKNDLLSLQSEIDVLEEDILGFAHRYGYVDGDALYTLSVLEEDVRAYRELLRAEGSAKERLAELEATTAGMERDCQAFLASYAITGIPLQAGLNKLASEIESYRTLQADKANAKATERELYTRLNEGESVMESILTKYGLNASVGTMDGLKRLELETRNAELLAKEIEKLEAELVDYKEKNGLTERPTAVYDTSDLRTRLSARRKELADCDKRILETEREVEKKPELETRLVLAQEKLEEYKGKYDLIVDTMSALTDAEQTLKDKYIKPIKDKFSRYAEALERVLDEKVSMDKDFKLVFERGGETRSDKHLSAGERTLCALCLRLALVDNMYEGELPFIVMDDPFVHLDGEHMARTAALLHELAKDKQLLYFCCHESRRA